MTEREGREGQQLGNYRLLTMLGRGGFAEVYLGAKMGPQAKPPVATSAVSPHRSAFGLFYNRDLGDLRRLERRDGKLMLSSPRRSSIRQAYAQVTLAHARPSNGSGTERAAQHAAVRCVSLMPAQPTSRTHPAISSWA